MLYVNVSRIHTDLPDAIASASGCILSPHSKAELKATASPMPAFAAETTFPERIDPRGWLKVENQGNVGSCFPAGHKVTMADGSVKNIEDVQIGDCVRTHLSKSKMVIATMQRFYKGSLVHITTVCGKSVTSTADHQFLIQKPSGSVRFEEANEVSLDCFLLDGNIQKDWLNNRSSNTTGTLEIAEYRKTHTSGLKVYDFEVADDHAFVCNGLHVHNCQGHSLTTTMEGAYYLATAGSIQLCRNFAYVMSQKVDNINGDSGSTVSGGVKVATSAGLCREELWKYSGSYTRNPPGGWDPLLKDALNYVAGGQTPIENYEQAFKFMASRLGWVHTGFMWGDSVDRQAGNGGVIETWSPGGGGHSVAFVGYTPEKSDGQGRPYLIQVNSWSERWGNNGFVLWSPKAFDAMCNHQWSEVVGIHSLKLGKDAVVPNWI